MKQKWINPMTDELFEAILKLENLDEARRFLRDLLTEPEILEFANRWRVARMLSEGVPYSEIEKATGMSSTTIARVNKWLKGKLGGYRMMLERMNRETEASQRLVSLGLKLKNGKTEELKNRRTKKLKGRKAEKAKEVKKPRSSGEVIFEPSFKLDHHHHQAQALEGG